MFLKLYHYFITFAQVVWDIEVQLALTTSAHDSHGSLLRRLNLGSNQLLSVGGFAPSWSHLIPFAPTHAADSILVRKLSARFNTRLEMRMFCHPTRLVWIRPVGSILAAAAAAAEAHTSTTLSHSIFIPSHTQQLLIPHCGLARWWAAEALLSCRLFRQLVFSSSRYQCRAL